MASWSVVNRDGTVESGEFGEAGCICCGAPCLIKYDHQNRPVETPICEECRKREVPIEAKE